MKQKDEEVPFLFGDLRSFVLHARRVQARIPAGFSTKERLLEALDVNLGFPDYFGNNWDALQECLTDLSWLDPVQVVIVHEDVPLENDPASSKTYLNILRSAVAHWRRGRGHELVVAFPSKSEGEVRELLVAYAGPSSSDERR
jgi:RNAse (barnase) inhibitor barstar